MQRHPEGIKEPIVESRKEDILRDYLYHQKVLVVAGQKGKELRFKLIAKEAKPPIYNDITFSNQLNWSGRPTMIGKLKHPVRFDLVATPIPERDELVIVELKVGRLAQKDIRQMLGYINHIRNLQDYGGKGGSKLLYKHLKLQVTGQTRVSGLLISRYVNSKLLQWLPDEFWQFVRVCTFGLTKGRNWPDNLQHIRIYDRGKAFLEHRNKKGKMLYDKLNPQYS